MRLRRDLLLVVLATAAALPAASPRALPDGYTRRVWQTQDGLPENTVQAFAQTPDNYLWIGTSGGLVRFDGAGFILFDRDNTPAIHENSIFGLTVSRDGSLWAATDGMGLLRYHSGVFRSYSTDAGLSNGFVRVVYQDRQGTLWAGTDNGLFRLEGERFVRVDGTGKIPTLAVHAIREDNAGNLWVGGSSVLRIHGDECKIFHLEGEGSVSRVKSILATTDGTVWVGTVSGLQRMQHLSGDSGRFERIPEIASTIRSLLQDRSGTLWIGSIGGGLIEYSNGRFTRITATDTPPSSTVLALFEDNERNIWAGMQTGLLRLSRTAMSTFPLPDAANADFGTVYSDRDGSLWVAGTHLYRINANRDKAEPIASPMTGVRVRSVLRDRAGTWWVGTEGAGVFHTSAGGRVQFAKRNGLVNDFIRAFLEGRDGSIWIATDEGISRWKDGALTNYRESDGLAYFSVRALIEDRRGDIWIGTERGVSHWSGGSFLKDPVTEGLKAEKVWTIREDQDGGLWFGTRGAGLFRWNTGKLSQLSTAHGLASNSVYQLLEDGRGTFWMSGPNGISAVARQDLNQAADHPGFHPAVTLYGLSDGVETTQIHGGVQPAGCLTPGGEIWFPSNRGPVRIIASQARPESLPKVVIEGVLVDGREAPVSLRLIVPPGEGKLQIGYSAVRLRSQERLRFRYMLEGFDKEWTEALRRRVAFYTNLPPGEYGFRVQAFDMNMPESVTEASLAIEWRPHLYRTAWFLILCGVSIVAAALGAYRLRLRQVHARFHAVLEERNRVAREMHDTVIQGCASVSAVLEAVASIQPEGSESRRDLLDCARAQVRATVDEARRAVWNLRQDATRSREIGPLIDQIARQVGHASHVPIRFATTGQAVTLDPAVEHDLLMVAREAVSNAVRHAQPREVRLQLDFESDRVRMQVHDDGCGFDPREALSASGEHFGLVGMRERVQRLGGRFDVTSAPGKGTDLLAEVPVHLGMDLGA
jgi:signal transduction histidine kinase/ligand-binding sensor domain-containing protein